VEPFKALYFSSSGQLELTVQLYCADAAAAVKDAKKMQEGRLTEIWHLGKLIARLNANRETSLGPPNTEGKLSRGC